MKNMYLLIAFCTLFSLSAIGQSAAPADQATKRITITTKKIDDNGKTITETWIAEGNEPENILKEMAVNPEIIQQMHVEGVESGNQERLFLSGSGRLTLDGQLVRSDGRH
jgi:hypothetical protein